MHNLTNYPNQKLKTQKKNIRTNENYQHGSDVHDTPTHTRAVSHIAAKHVGDDNLGKINISNIVKSGIVQMLREPGIAAAWD